LLPLLKKLAALSLGKFQIVCKNTTQFRALSEIMQIILTAFNFNSAVL
jgi:hypothetical protein